MFSFIKDLAVSGFVGSYRDGDITTITGIPARAITSDILRLWKTNVIERYMLTKVTRTSISFHEFFALDLYHVVKELVDSKRCSHRRTMAQIRDEIIKSTWVGEMFKETPQILNRQRLSQFKLAPLPKQLGFFDEAERLLGLNHIKGMLLDASAGSGKTFASVALSEMLEDVDLTIVACPNPARGSPWYESLRTERSFFHTPPKSWVIGFDEGKPTFNERYIVVNFEALEKLLNWIKASPVAKSKRISVILDECHNLTETTALRTNLFIEMCATVNLAFVILMSGTPIKALARELVPLFRVIDPLFTKECEEAFLKAFKSSKGKAYELLQKRLHSVRYLIERKEMSVAPPKFVEEKIKTPNASEYGLTKIREGMNLFIEERNRYYDSRKKEDEAAYLKFVERYAEDIGKKSAMEKADYRTYLHYVEVLRGPVDLRQCGAEIKYCNGFEKRYIEPLLSREEVAVWKEVKTLYKYRALKIQGECLGRFLGRKRIEAHLELCQYIDYDRIIESTEKKTLIFTSNVEVLQATVEELKKREFAPLTAYGETKDLYQTVGLFRDDPRYNPLVATYSKLSTAVPLTMADVMIMIDSPWRDYMFQQAVARISRLGATTQTTIYTVMLDTGSEPNLSTRAFDVLKWSQEQVEKITGVKSPYELADSIDRGNVSVEGFGDEVQTLDNNAPSLEQFLLQIDAYNDRLYGASEQNTVYAKLSQW